MTQLLDLIIPGDVLYEEFIKPLNISQNQLACDIDVPPNHIHAISA
ncbi:transcriptional regulator [Rickettsia montanensis]|uniref:XRE family transcriptional regulator n=1 Tax=Rickettsia montanensis (strain OSU 85-930) TaxID=1105114 RepID=H8KD24_RICMS|nr:XRE family transcriptional regulator [Rickettsia montanensis]AFC74015.1 XRE family transcriptional regulator [Rickettsia montanensis str. OSU 85-930]